MRGNKLKIDKLPTGRGTWTYKDFVMLSACFQILIDFVDQEKPQKIVDYKNNPAQRREWKEIQALCKYWKKDRPKMIRQHESFLRRSGINMKFGEKNKDGTQSVSIVYKK